MTREKKPNVNGTINNNCLQLFQDPAEYLNLLCQNKTLKERHIAVKILTPLILQNTLEAKNKLLELCKSKIDEERRIALDTLVYLILKGSNDVKKILSEMAQNENLNIKSVSIGVIAHPIITVKHLKKVFPKVLINKIDILNQDIMNDTIVKYLKKLQTSDNPINLRIGLSAAIILSKTFDEEIISKEDFLKAFQELKEKSPEHAKILLDHIKGDENLKYYMPSEE
jgi:hypothetical protein